MEKKAADSRPASQNKMFYSDFSSKGLNLKISLKMHIRKSSIKPPRCLIYLRYFQGDWLIRSGAYWCD